MVSALCTTSKPYVLVRRVSDDKATSRVPPGTPRDEEIRGWSLQARLRAREGGLKSLEVLWVLGVDPAAGGGPEDQRMAVLHLTEKPILLNYRSVTRGVPFDFSELIKILIKWLEALRPLTPPSKMDLCVQLGPQPPLHARSMSPKGPEGQSTDPERNFAIRLI